MNKRIIVTAFLFMFTSCQSTQTQPQSIESATSQVASTEVFPFQVNLEDHNKVLSTFDRGYDSGIDRHKYRDALNADALTAFVSSGRNVDSRNETGKTALMLTSSADVMQALIKAGADVNARDVEGRVPLMFLGDHNCFADSFASVVPQIGCDRLYQEDEDDEFEPGDIPCAAVCAQVLIKAGADVNAKDLHGRTPLMHLQNADGLMDWEDDTEFYVKVLIDAGADVNARDNDGMTPLMHITNEKCAQQLIDAGADVNAKDNKGRTPLMLIGGDDNIEALIKAGADVNAKDNDGQTVLMHQMKLSRAHGLEDEIIQSLIKAGADIEAKDNQGRTLQDIPSPAE